MKLRIPIIVSILGVAILYFSHSRPAQAASATGAATASVIQAIAIANVSALDFGERIQSDIAKTVAPGSSENAENGSFNVTGQSGRTYTITLPTSAVTITTGSGATANEQLTVSSFLSTPSTSGTLTGGSQTLFVGATLSAIGASQVTGAYTGHYTVSVVY